MKNLIIDLNTKTVSRVDVTPEQIAQREAEEASRAIKTENDKAAKRLKKNFKDTFLNSLSPNQRKGLEAIIEDGNLD
jgi:hypothetical protein